MPTQLATSALGSVIPSLWAILFLTASKGDSGTVTLFILKAVVPVVSWYISFKANSTKDNFSFQLVWVAPT